MKKKSVLIAFALVLLLTASAVAEVFDGTTVAKNEETILSNCGGTLSSICIEKGQHVNAGDVVGYLKTDKVFASENGTVARVTASVGEDVSGTLVEAERDYYYDVYCTVDDAYEKPETEIVHIGETVYIKCTKDGTHRGVGTIVSIDGSDYNVKVIGGELYVGETVYLYRDTDFTSSTRVGIGTVVGSESIEYEANGTVTGLYVSEGDYVEEGQLLFETVESGDGTLTTDVSGIVTEVNVAEGDHVEEGTALIKVVPDDAIGIEIAVAETEIPYINVGDTAYITYACDDIEEQAAGKVSAIAQIAENGYYTVQVTPDELPKYVGMSVEVRINDN